MKLGFDNKREVIFMAIAVVAAVLLMSRFLFQGDVAQTATKAAPTKASAQANRPGATRGRGRQWTLPKDLQPSLDPSLKSDLLKASETTAYDGGKRNIFREQAEVTPIPQPITPVIPPPPVNTGPPPPPPIPLKYYGFANKPGEPRKVFLSNGDEVFVAEEGQVIQRRYKIGKITPTSVEVEDVLNNNKQTIPLTQG